jgi:hypothetical protein
VIVVARTHHYVGRGWRRPPAPASRNVQRISRVGADKHTRRSGAAARFVPVMVVALRTTTVVAAVVSVCSEIVTALPPPVATKAFAGVAEVG